MSELLLRRGANLSARDAHFAATPLQWAATAAQPELEALLASHDIGIFDAVLCENANRMAALLDAEPELLETTIGAQRPGGEPHSEDWQTPLAFAATRNRLAAAGLLRQRGARLDVEDGGGRRALVRLVDDGQRLAEAPPGDGAGEIRQLPGQLDVVRRYPNGHGGAEARARQPSPLAASSANFSALPSTIVSKASPRPALGTNRRARTSPAMWSRWAALGFAAQIRRTSDSVLPLASSFGDDG